MEKRRTGLFFIAFYLWNFSCSTAQLSLSLTFHEFSSVTLLCINYILLRPHENILLLVYHHWARTLCDTFKISKKKPFSKYSWISLSISMLQIFMKKYSQESLRPNYFMDISKVMVGEGTLPWATLCLGPSRFFFLMRRK